MASSIDSLCRDDLRTIEDVEQQARDLLEQHSHFRGRSDLFRYEYQGDVLIVRGTVPTFYLKQLLQAAFKELQGPARIDNQVMVVSCVNATATISDLVEI